jgi:glycosyltransferase involved in cell wall biosynthesis
MERRTDLFLFESHYSADVFRDKVAVPSGLVRVVHNGVAEADFAPIVHAADASDLVFVGELRLVKGIDVLIDAVAALTRGGRKVTATIVGEGPDGDELRARAIARGLADTVRFVGVMPAREGFRRGRLLIVPSLRESLPYIVLEAGAAAIPLLATRVGGIPEILGPDANRLVPAGDPAALVRAITAALDDPGDSRTAAMRLRERVRSAFSAAAMVDGVLAAYADALKAQGKVNG